METTTKLVTTTLEEYLHSELGFDSISGLTKTGEFLIHVQASKNGTDFYIRPLDKDGDTLDYEVVGNTLECTSEKANDS